MVFGAGEPERKILIENGFSTNWREQGSNDCRPQLKKPTSFLKLKSSTLPVYLLLFVTPPIMIWSTMLMFLFTVVNSDQVVVQEDPLLPWDNIRLTAASCQDGPTYSRFLPPNADSITPQEECNTCSSIVTNMNRWNWQKHYSSMCVGVPRHLVDLCKHYACKMAIQCPEFISNKCVVDGYERFPCPAKYLCWNCLGKHLKDRWMNGLGYLWRMHAFFPLTLFSFSFTRHACTTNCWMFRQQTQVN